MLKIQLNHKIYRKYLKGIKRSSHYFKVLLHLENVKSIIDLYQVIKVQIQSYQIRIKVNCYHLLEKRRQYLLTICLLKLNKKNLKIFNHCKDINRIRVEVYLYCRLSIQLMKMLMRQPKIYKEYQNKELIILYLNKLIQIINLINHYKQNRADIRIQFIKWMI